MPKRPQTLQEEVVNALTHGFGLIAGLIGIFFLLGKAIRLDQVKPLLGAMLFSLGIIMVYSFSTAYHATKNSRKKAKLQILDHVSIYFLIAGSYTPMILAILKTDKAILFLSIIWGSVLIGTVFKIFFTRKFKTLSVVLYLTMGWLALFFLNDLLEKVPYDTLFWIGTGGASYTLGVIFYVKSERLFFHAIWHLFALAGTTAHFLAVYQLIGQ